MKSTILVISVLWELPQNLLGLMYLIIYRKRILLKEVIHHRLFVGIRGFSISLGHFIFYAKNVWENPEKLANKEFMHYLYYGHDKAAYPPLIPT